jgi:hypothetical protein
VHTWSWEGPRSGAPGPDGHHDDLDADELEGLALLVPDDARSLDPDRAAYLEELRGRRSDQPSPTGVRRALWGLNGRRLGRFGLSGPVIVLVLAAVAVVGSSLTIFSPSNGSTSAQMAPIATNPPAQVGSVGGLLPDANLTVDGLQVPLRSARPALIVLVPAACQGCGDTLRSLLMQGREYGLPLVLAGPPTQSGELGQLNTVELGGSGLVALDPGNVLNPAYAPSGITAVLVHQDGVVGAVVRDVSSTQRLEPALAQLERPGAPTAAP